MNKVNKIKNRFLNLILREKKENLIDCVEVNGIRKKTYSSITETIEAIEEYNIQHSM